MRGMSCTVVGQRGWSFQGQSVRAPSINISNDSCKVWASHLKSSHYQSALKHLKHFTISVYCYYYLKTVHKISARLHSLPIFRASVWVNQYDILQAASHFPYLYTRVTSYTLSGYKRFGGTLFWERVKIKLNVMFYTLPLLEILQQFANLLLFCSSSRWWY